MVPAIRSGMTRHLVRSVQLSTQTRPIRPHGPGLAVRQLIGSGFGDQTDMGLYNDTARARPTGIATARLSVAIAAFGAVFSQVNPALAVSGATEVKANYKLVFNGLNVGGYNFTSSFDRSSYSASSNASLSALFGAFKWKGDIAANGRLNKDRPAPNSYQLSFKGNKKKGLIRLGFAGGGIKSVEVQPQKRPKPDQVPVNQADLKNVYDPMSAIMAISQAPRKAPCSQTIPVFDGKIRFNLAFSYKGQERAGKDGEALTVCRVKYIPLAGHQPKDFENPWVDYDKLEIAVRYVPSAEIFVPYRVTIPTTLGAAEMRIGSVRISQPDQPEIALGP